MCREGINQIGKDLSGAQIQFHFIDQFSFFTGSERRGNVCSLLKQRGLIIFLLAGKFLPMAKTSPGSGGFICFVSITKPTLVGVVKTCNSTSSSQPFWGVRAKSLATGNYMTLICKRCFPADPRVNFARGHRWMHSFPFAGWWKDCGWNSSLEKVMVPKHMHPFTPALRTVALCLVDQKHRGTRPAEPSDILISLHGSALQAVAELKLTSSPWVQHNVLYPWPNQMDHQESSLQVQAQLYCYRRLLLWLAYLPNGTYLVYMRW